jgi:quercetin dioxygenase-like cupin family protein
MIVRDYREVEANEVEGLNGVTVRWVIAKDDGAPHFAMRVFDVQPGCSTPHHKHWWEHEVFVLGGKGVVRGKESERPIEGGSVVFIAGEELHQFVNTGTEVLRFICLVPHQ